MTRIREENRQSRSFEIFLTVKLGIYLGVSEIGEFLLYYKMLENLSEDAANKSIESIKPNTPY